jgi:protein-ribulosamine 3-kinase
MELPVVHQYILETLQKAIGTSITNIQLSAVGGGSINDTYRVQANTRQSFFCKVNKAADFPAMFLCEKQGLELLARTGVIRVPAVIAVGEAGPYQVLLLEHIESGLKTDDFWKRFGEQLAALHQVTSEQFGLDTDNYMGALSQQNEPMDDWCSFFIHRRLEPQVKRAVDNHLMEVQQARRFNSLYRQLPSLFESTTSRLLHGDLWSGNFLCNEVSQPVLIDPAVYYGHPAVDLGMTTLFGGFAPAFYESYHHHAPSVPNYREQWQVCNVYPLLIHLNLFGKGYLPDILHTIEHY